MARPPGRARRPRRGRGGPAPRTGCGGDERARMCLSGRCGAGAVGRRPRSAVGGHAPEVDVEAPRQAPQVLHVKVNAVRGGGHPGCAEVHPKVHRVGLPVKSSAVSPNARIGRTAKVPLTAGSWNPVVRPASYLAFTAATKDAIGSESVSRSAAPSITT